MTPPEIAQRYAGAPVLVLGASGFIGRWVARALSRTGAALHLAIRRAESAKTVLGRFAVEGTVHQADLSDPAAAEQLIQRVKPAIVFNLAGYGVDPLEKAAADRETYYRINRDLPLTVAETLLSFTPSHWLFQRLVHVGSALEYGDAGGDLRESSNPHPATLYGQSKLAATEALGDLANGRGLRCVIARLFTVYGPGEHPGRLLPSLHTAARAGVGLTLTAGTQRRDFTFVGDVAEGLLRLGVAPCRPGEIVNLATGRLASVKEFALTAARILHLDEGHLTFGPLPTRAEEMSHDPVNVGRLLELTDWAPGTELADGIARTVGFRAAESATGGEEIGQGA